MKQLTQKQIFALTDGKKHWTEKKKHISQLAKSFGIFLSSDEDMHYLMEVHCQNEEKRIKRQYMEDSKTGKRLTVYTPTDVKGGFNAVKCPIIGKRYHLSWAYSGSLFVLKKIDGEKCYMDNPKYPRQQLLECNLVDLRETRKNSKTT